MKIAILTPSNAKVAPNAVADNLCKSLQTHNIAQVFCLSAVTTNLKYLDFEIFSFKTLKFLMSADVVHSMGFRPDLIVTILKIIRVVSCKTVSTVHSDIDIDLVDLYGKQKGFFYYKLWSSILNRFDVIIYINKSQARRLSSIRGKRKTVVINNYFDINIKNKIIRKPLGKKLLYCGSLRAIKGVDLIINAMKQLPDYTLDIYGAGPNEVELKQLCCLYNLTNVNFCGHSSDLQKVYSSYNVLIVPSRSDSFAFVILEGLANGLNVICSDIDSFVELYSNSSVSFFQSDSSFKLVSQIIKPDSDNAYINMPPNLNYSLLKNRKYHLDAYNC